MAKIGLFFGTFNPIHHGHLMMANYLVNNTDIDKLFFVVSPNSPFKDTQRQLVSFEQRCKMIDLSIVNNKKMMVSKIESELDTPMTYTYNALIALKEQYKNDEFVLIIGADNLLTLHSWYRIADILQMIDIIVIPRNDIDCISCADEIYREYPNVKNICIAGGCPYCSLSSTFVREQIKDNKDIGYYVTDAVQQYIVKHNLYAD